MRQDVDIRQREGELTGLAEAILRQAKRLGAAAAEVSVSEDIGLTVKVRKGELETLEFNADRSFGIAVYDGQRKG
ncbi:MAG: metalloprotease PmbA, partial [Gammaproteobacteria bacterium]|nr:metalloprotease PmbA [Gammaproteobacteria bacterium]